MAFPSPQSLLYLANYPAQQRGIYPYTLNIFMSRAEAISLPQELRKGGPLVVGFSGQEEDVRGLDRPP